jgi:hypothetical protein
VGVQRWWAIKLNPSQTPEPRRSDRHDEVIERPRWQEYKKNLTELLIPYIDYYENSLIPPEEVELAVHAIPFKIPQGEITLTGKIDKIEKRNGEYIVVDYKTGGTYSDKTKADQKAALIRQGVFYVLLLDQYRGGVYRTRKIMFDFLKPNSDGEYEHLVIEVTNEQLDFLKQEIRDFAEDIMTGSFINRLYLRDDSIKDYLDLFDIIKQ